MLLGLYWTSNQIAHEFHFHSASSFDHPVAKSILPPQKLKRSRSLPRTRPRRRRRIQPIVSRTPTKPPPSPRIAATAGTVPPSKPTPSPVVRRRHALRRRPSPATTKRRVSPLKSLACAPAAAAATFYRSLRSCRRRLLKLSARLAVLGSPRKRRAAAAGFQRLRSSSPPSPPPSMSPAVRAQSAALPPQPSPGRPTLFLDLDDTLIHSQIDTPPARFDITVRPVIGGKPVTYYVAKRPGVEEFLRAAAERFEVVVFTAGLQEYASPVLDRLDPDGEVFAHRLCRGACRDAGDGTLVKDLAATGRPLDRAVIVDDNPDAFALQPENAVPVASFVDDDNDHELRRVMNFLELAEGYEDIREAIRDYHNLIMAASGWSKEVEMLKHIVDLKKEEKIQEEQKEWEGIAKHLDLVRACGVTEDSEEFYVASRLFKDDYNRIIFSGLITDAGRIAWLRRSVKYWSG